MNYIDEKGLLGILKLILHDISGKADKSLISNVLTGEITTSLNTSYTRTIKDISEYDFLFVKIKKDFSEVSKSYTAKNENGNNETVNFTGTIATSTDIIYPAKDMGKLIQSATFFGIKYGFPSSGKFYLSNDGTSAGILTYEVYGVKLGGQK
ncbi:MAG: hypothetical protein NC253_07930 [Ruminococcus sp.]|nr:hypothetical protein [Ruminococcus sp.]MCM1380575.1 hypothetical protein [Muribaculaceae bacterium]MCM1480440.1 hypothetical protein [Muribaculaceae bacterium]